jgi:FkbM family methyltransferase
MLTIIKLLLLVSCKNRREVLWWFLGFRYAGRKSELLLKLAWDGRDVVIPVQEIQTLVAGLMLFTPENPWERWCPARDPGRVIDLGANVGLVSLYFALRFPDAQIVAVEMMPENAAAIKRLANLNRLNIEVVNVAVGATEGTASVRLNQSHTRHSLEALQSDGPDRFGFKDQTVTVPITRLGSLVRELGWTSVDLLKVDIEGAEKLLLDDIDSWSGLVSNALMEIHHNMDAREAEAIMAKHSFKKTGHDNFHRTELWFSKC